MSRLLVEHKTRDIKQVRSLQREQVCGEGWKSILEMLTCIAWEFIETEKPNFDLVTITPPMVYGPIRHSVSSPKQLNESNLRIYNLFINSKRDAELPPNGMHVYTDVRVNSFRWSLETVLTSTGSRIRTCTGSFCSWSFRSEIYCLRWTGFLATDIGRCTQCSPGVRGDDPKGNSWCKPSAGQCIRL
jgi:hypothetical protein